ncbi:MAG: preprotein translocase subunit SecG [Alphaproteobacteria bacterium]|nr:preprotein translocase subunit SecG [Alphaproteobacteria bacterium]OJV15963.1 MAG: preprotein translocase subunit SecG [Alphaproteobacteria bacterium 33-17]
METILLIIQITVAILLVAVVMIQKTSSDSVGSLSGSANSFVQVSSSNFFTKTTAILATIFMVNSLLLTIAMDKKYNASPITESTLKTEENKVVIPNLDKKD